MTLTREETIERLKQNKAAADYYAGQSQITAEIENALKDSEAFDMAIEALSPRRREDATEEDYAYCEDCDAVEMCMWYPYDGCIFKIQSRPQGEWIFNPTDAIDLMFAKPKCSKCGFESSDGGNFCPNCGARMKGGDDE